MNRAYLRVAAVLCTTVFLGGCRDELAPDAIVVKDLSFDGVQAVDEARLRDIVATQESSRLPWGRRRTFNRDQFQADLKRIEAFYADRGFPDARVSSFDVQLNQAQDAVTLKIVIAEGQPVLIDEIRWVGFDRLPADHLESLRQQAPIKQGAPRNRQLIEATTQLALDELKDHGHPYARVDREIDDLADRRVRITFTASPGPQAYFGAIETAGNTSVNNDSILRQLAYRPGELFRISQVRESQRRLYSLELFEFVNVEPLDVDARPAEVRTRATVTEGKHRRVTFGLGYGTEEQVRGDVQWRHVNFFGGARTLSARGKWSSLDRGGRLEFNQPFLFRQGFSLAASGQRWFADEPAYELDTIGGRATVSWRHTLRDRLVRERGATRLGVSFIQEFEQFAIRKEALLDLSLRNKLIALGLDPRTGVGEGMLGAVAFDAQRNTTPNLLDARQGYVASLHLEQAGKWLPGDFTYVELSGEGRHYWTVLPRFVLANRLKFGVLTGPGTDVEGLRSTAVPFFKRYFLGGANSLRGWGRFDVSPLSGSGLPLGGLTSFEFTSELRVPIVGNFGGVLFLDAGNVWANSWDIKLDDLRYAVGPGVRYTTPIGPVRFDLGYQLTPIEGLLVDGRPEKRRWRVHFSIGQAF